MVVKSDSPSSGSRKLWKPFSDAELGDPAAYVKRQKDLLNAASKGTITPLEWQRYRSGLSESCEENTGVTIREAIKQGSDSIKLFRGLLDTTEGDLRRVQAGVRDIDAMRMHPEEKKKIRGLIDEAIALQAECRADPIKCATYVGRDAETAALYDWQPFQFEFFDIWNDTDNQHSLVMAPPGHGKSELLRMQAIFEIGHSPNLRCLFILDTKEKANDTCLLLKALMKSPRYKALFPEVRVLGRSDDAKDSASQFTVTRPNWTSREATIEAAGIGSNINGKGYDRIYGDDFFPPSYADSDTQRNKANKTWTSVVEARLRSPQTARTRIIHTPWHERDTVGVIQREVAEGRLPGWIVKTYPILDDANRKAIPLWPSRFNQAFLEQQKWRCDTYEQNYRLSCQQRHEVLVPGVHYFNSICNSEMSTPLDHQWLDCILRSERWLSIDPSATAGKQSSYTGVVEIVISSNGYCFVTDAWFLKLEPVEMEAWVIDKIYNAPNPGYTGIQVESQAGMKFGVNLWERDIRKAMKTGMCPKKDLSTGQWGEEQREPYKKHLEILSTDTRMGTARQNLSKRQRLKLVSPMLRNGVVKFAGQRIINHVAPGGHQQKLYVGPIKSSRIIRLVGHIKEFDQSPITDGVDALTQWLIVHGDRINSPTISGPEQVADIIEKRNPIVSRMIRVLSPKREDDEDDTNYEDAVFAKHEGGEQWN